MNNNLFRAFSSRSFLHLWIGEVFTQISSNFFNFFLVFLVFSLTHSNSKVAFVVTSFTVPAIFLGIVAGAYVDRWNKKHVLLTTNIIDSLGSFRMIAFLEETFPLTIEDTDMVPENFQTLNDVEIFIANKLGNGANGSSDPAPITAPEVRELVSV